MAEDQSTIFLSFYEDNEVRVSGKNIPMHYLFFAEFFSCLQNNVLSLQAMIFSRLLDYFFLLKIPTMKTFHFSPYSHFFTVDYRDGMHGMAA